MTTDTKEIVAEIDKRQKQHDDLLRKDLCYEERIYWDSSLMKSYMKLLTECKQALLEQETEVLQGVVNRVNLLSGDDLFVGGKSIIVKAILNKEE